MTLPVLSFDLDGTLTNAQGILHPRDRELLLHPPAGITFIPNTGRPLGAMKGLLARNGVIFPGDVVPYPLVLHNGGALFLPGERLVESVPFTEALQAALLELVRAFPLVTTTLHAAERVYLLHPTPFGDQAVRFFDLQVTPVSEMNGARLLKFMSLSDRADDLAEIARLGAAAGAHATFSMPILCELNPPGVDKGRGLLRLLDLLGLSGSPLYAAGDGGNDLAMLRVAGRSYAPNWAADSARAAASALIDPRPEGILAPILREILNLAQSPSFRFGDQRREERKET